jgi:trk system potassium uptake protein
MRYRAYLRDRYSTMVVFTARIVSLIGVILLLPLVILPFYPDEVNYAWSFIATGLTLIIGGGLIGWRLKRAVDASLDIAEGSVIVLFAWLIAMLAGAVPFIVIDDLNFTQALFESTSGWTTTGLSVVDVTTTPNIILFYRSVLQLAGGAGFAVIMVSALSGPVGLGLNIAEARTDQLAPHIRQSALIVIRIYSGYVIFGIIALWLAGMSLFDAINHSFAAISTGGFSTRAESIGYWDNTVIEAVVIVLMLLGTINFLTAYTLIRGKYKDFTRNSEVRLLFTLLPIMSVLLFVGVAFDLYDSIEKGVRVSIFEIASALSTTGFATVDYNTWLVVSDFGWLLLIALMTIGGGSGSTSGGIKQYRVFVLFKGIVWEFRRAFMSPYTVNEPSVWQGEHQGFLTDARVRVVALFVSLYVFGMIVGTGLLTLHGYSLADSFFEFASTIGTVGLSVGVTSADAAASQLWVQIFGMFLGRLEFFAVIVGLIKLVQDTQFWLSKES